MSASIVSALIAAGVAASTGVVLTDQGLVAYASHPFDKRAKMNTHEVLGLHRGAEVVVDFPCGDICPDYTVRLIHYSVEPGAACDRIGGVTAVKMVARGPAVFPRKVCAPTILVDRKLF